MPAACGCTSPPVVGWLAGCALGVALTAAALGCAIGCGIGISPVPAAPVTVTVIVPIAPFGPLTVIVTVPALFAVITPVVGFTDTVVGSLLV